MMDINMMAANPPGAGERTFEGSVSTFARAGFADPRLVKMRDLVLDGRHGGLRPRGVLFGRTPSPKFVGAATTPPSRPKLASTL